MKLEGNFSIYELRNYIFAKNKRPAFQAIVEELVEQLYDDVPVTRTVYDYAGNRVVQGGFNLENYVIDMIEKKELYLKHLERLKNEEELLDMAIESLTPREKDVIQVHYFNRNNDLGLSLEFFQEILQEAEIKLCVFLDRETQVRRLEADRVRKEQLQTEVNQWKRGRARVV